MPCNQLLPFRLREASVLLPVPWSPTKVGDHLNFSNSEIHLFISGLFSLWFISRLLLIKQIYVCMYVFKKGKVCDVTYEVWVVLRQQESVVKLATAGWKRCE